MFVISYVHLSILCCIFCYLVKVYHIILVALVVIYVFMYL